MVYIQYEKISPSMNNSNLSKEYRCMGDGEVAALYAFNFNTKNNNI